MEESAAQRLALRSERKRRRRFSSACFFLAGIGFGTAFYVTRSHFMRAEAKPLAYLALVALMAALFWLGARAENEVSELEEKLRELEAAALAARRRPRRST